jgi:NAD(P)-dependent dehydrogenase (short-subunit alcohol dehydrogenase family)
MSSNVDNDIKRLVIITGSSRGIGRSIATEFSRVFKNNTHFILIARDLVNLGQVKNDIIKISNETTYKLDEDDISNEEDDEEIIDIVNKSSTNHVSLIKCDFGSPHSVDDYFQLLKNVLPELYNDTQDDLKYNELYIVYNHGSLEFGSISLVGQNNLNKKYEINLFSVWNLLSAVNLLLPVSLIPVQYHVNTSSNFALKPVSNWSCQCSGMFGLN